MEQLYKKIIEYCINRKYKEYKNIIDNSDFNESKKIMMYNAKSNKNIISRLFKTINKWDIKDQIKENLQQLIIFKKTNSEYITVLNNCKVLINCNIDTKINIHNDSDINIIISDLISLLDTIHYEQNEYIKQEIKDAFCMIINGLIFKISNNG